MNVFAWTHRQFFLIFCTVFSGILFAVTPVAASGYLGIPWQAGFPKIEQRYPSIVFESENAFHLTVFTIPPKDRDIISLELKLFKNRLTAVDQKYSVSLTPFMNEEYIRRFVSDLGIRKKVEKRSIPTAQGMTDTTLWDYGDVLVFFQTYPPTNVRGLPQPLNSVKFVHKATFKEMMQYIRSNPGGDPDALDDDFDAVSF